MFSQNRNQPILTEFRGCFPHAEMKWWNYNLLGLSKTYHKPLILAPF